eukprot:3553790-Amphidinium_carterae.1
MDCMQDFQQCLSGLHLDMRRKACPEGVINIVKEKGTKRAAVGDLKLFTVDRQCLEPFRELGVTVESVPGSLVAYRDISCQILSNSTDPKTGVMVAFPNSYRGHSIATLHDDHRKKGRAVERALNCQASG